MPPLTHPLLLLQAFCSELDLKFTLLADEGGKVRELYKVPKVRR